LVALGALIDPTALVRGLRWLAVLAGLLLATKLIPIYLLARFAPLPGRAFQVAIGFGQIGEFSFVLATIGVASHVMPSDLYAAILAAVVLSIAASTLLVRAAHPRAARPAQDSRSGREIL